jgi:hypothetical protein
MRSTPRLMPFFILVLASAWSFTACNNDGGGSGSGGGVSGTVLFADGQLGSGVQAGRAGCSDDGSGNATGINSSLGVVRFYYSASSFCTFLQTATLGFGTNIVPVATDWTAYQNGSVTFTLQNEQAGPSMFFTIEDVKGKMATVDLANYGYDRTSTALQSFTIPAEDLTENAGLGFSWSKINFAAVFEADSPATAGFTRINDVVWHQ